MVGKPTPAVGPASARHPGVQTSSLGAPPSTHRSRTHSGVVLRYSRVTRRATNAPRPRLARGSKASTVSLGRRREMGVEAVSEVRMGVEAGKQ
jgi:hypothetical protein